MHCGAVQKEMVCKCAVGKYAHLHNLCLFCIIYSGFAGNEEGQGGTHDTEALWLPWFQKASFIIRARNEPFQK